MKLLFYVCCITLQFIYLGMGEFREIPLVQTLLGPMDIFLALAIPIGFSKAIMSFAAEKPFTFNGAFYSLGFLLLFTASQIMHGTVGNVMTDTITMTQEPNMEEKIALLVDQALFDQQPDQRVKAASLLYLVSGVKTMYQSKDHQYLVFTPTQEERQERMKWEQTNSRVDTMKDEIFDRVIAITNRSIFHVASFFVLFSIMLLMEVVKSRQHA